MKKQTDGDMVQRAIDTVKAINPWFKALYGVRFTETRHQLILGYERLVLLNQSYEEHTVSDFSKSCFRIELT